MAGVDRDATELVDDLRKPMKETESRLLFRGTALDVEGVELTEDWRGTRDVDVEGEPRIDGCRTLGVAPSSLSITPNSLVEKLVGEGFVEVVTSVLVRRVANADPLDFKGGEPAADVRLDIRGIFVGVSLGRPEVEFKKEAGGSLPSLRVCELLVPVVATEGEPAIVGS